MIVKNLSDTAQRRLCAEERKIRNEGNEIGFFAHPFINASTKERDYQKWNIYIKGTEGSLYEGHVIHAEMIFPFEYPIHPPELIFKTEMFHPNIYTDGKVCISILHMAGDDPTSHELPDEKWTPVQGIRTIVLSVISLLNEPNTNSPANVDASKAFNNSRNEYDSKVKKILSQKSVKIENVKFAHDLNDKDYIFLDELFSKTKNQ